MHIYYFPPIVFAVIFLVLLGSTGIISMVSKFMVPLPLYFSKIRMMMIVLMFVVSLSFVWMIGYNSGVKDSKVISNASESLYMTTIDSLLDIVVEMKTNHFMEKLSKKGKKGKKGK